MSNKKAIIFIAFKGTPKWNRALYQGEQDRVNMQQMVRWYESQGWRHVHFEDESGRRLDVNSFPLSPPAPTEKEGGE